jgi:dTDP-4-dehydrorhamnose reductase
MEEYFILRTSLLYGANRNNPVKALLEGLQQGKEVLAASDQVISPTYVVDFARALKEFLSQVRKKERKEIPYGIYHLANSGACSRYQFASKVAELSGFDSKQVKKVLLEEIPKVARRPKFSALSSEKFEQFASFEMRSWQSALEDYLSNFKR